MSKPSILVVKLGAIGDVVLSLPMLHMLRKTYPETHITLMIGQASAALLEHDPDIDKLWIVDENDFWQKRLGSLLKILWSLQRRRFQTVYILHWSALFHGFFWLAGIAERIGFSREGRAFRLTRQVPYYEGDAAHHDADLYASLIQGPIDHPLSPHIILTDFERAEAERLWQTLEAKPGQRRVVMAPGGGHNAKLVMPLKRWPAASFSELTQRLDKDNMCVVVAGSREEKTLLESVQPMAERNVAGKLSLRQTAALIATSHLFVGNDSGLSHIATAVGKPSLVFFGPTSPQGKQARGVAQKILYRREACSPCYRFGYAPPCPYQMKCLTQISVSEAQEAIRELMGHRVP